MKHTRKLQVIGLIALFIVIVSAGVPVNDKPKNLKVLPKNISEKELDRVMDNFQLALNVDCNFCHVKNKATQAMEYEKDDKPEKEITRNMMRMTNAINKTYFTLDKKADPNAIQAVTCATCHRGKPRPELDSLIRPN
ncbi:MAG: c-type cytochrome [Chitinophagaceae bacterium]|nr:c-type cytochrome [Chitinophagaceae bacterium]